MRKNITILICAAVLSAGAPGLSAQNLLFTAGGGVSRLTGDGGEFWNTGSHLVAQGYFRLFSNILVGGRVAYNRFSPDAGEFAAEIGPYSGVEVDITGSGSVIEVLPQVRFVLPAGERSRLRLFAQAGGGFYIVGLDAKAEVAYLGSSTTVEFDLSESKPGIDFGAGIGFEIGGGLSLEVLPLYHIIFTEGESSKYFNLSVSLVLNR